MAQIFSQEAETETTAALELAAEKEEEEADNMSFVDLCEQIEALERRVIVQRMHIQQSSWKQMQEENTSPRSSWERLDLSQHKERWQQQHCHREKLSNSSVMRLQN
jgi:hypothetical protein